jgi:hypothetical protein
MKRSQVMMVAALLFFAVGTVARAQMGMNFFKKPAMASMFRPVVGNGAVYQTTSGPRANQSMEMLVVGKDVADGKEAYWIEFGFPFQQGTMYSKVLVTKDDFQFHRTIFQMPGQPAMEMPFNQSARTTEKIEDELKKWTQVGSESVTVPAGTFTCTHWKKSDGSSDVWANDSISPFSMVKEAGKDSNEVLVKVLTGATDHITGPVTPFNPMIFRQMAPPNQ